MVIQKNQLETAKIESLFVIEVRSKILEGLIQILRIEESAP